MLALCRRFTPELTIRHKSNYGAYSAARLFPNHGSSEDRGSGSAARSRAAAAPPAPPPLGDELVDLLNQEEDGEGHNQELDHRIDELAIGDDYRPGIRVAFNVAWLVPLRVMKKFDKSMPPSSRPMGGIMMSLTRELTIAVNATPMRCGRRQVDKSLQCALGCGCI